MGVLAGRQRSTAQNGDFPKVMSSLLDEPGIELLSWAVLTLSSNCQPGRSVQRAGVEWGFWDGRQQNLEEGPVLSATLSFPGEEGVICGGCRSTASFLADAGECCVGW